VGVGGVVILCQLPTVGARRPMEEVATEGCVRQCAQVRAGVGSVLTRKKKDQGFSTTQPLSHSNIRIEMAADRVWVGYPRVSGPAGSGLGMNSHPQFSVSVSGLVSGSVSGLIFHP
jgi:hypothetical protein